MTEGQEEHVPNGDASGGDDALDGIRTRLDALEDVAVEDRPEIFEQVNETLVAELSAMDDDDEASE